MLDACMLQQDLGFKKLLICCTTYMNLEFLIFFLQDGFWATVIILGSEIRSSSSRRRRRRRRRNRNPSLLEGWIQVVHAINAAKGRYSCLHTLEIAILVYLHIIFQAATLRKEGHGGRKQAEHIQP
jgi:hypothetical protein